MNGRTFAPVAVLGLLLPGAIGACSSRPSSAVDATEASAFVDRRIAGLWRLADYRADATLSPLVLLRMREDDLRVRFGAGRVQSATPGLELDRAYVVDRVQGVDFRLTITDDDGLRYENACRFEPDGSVRFRTLTPPWQGEGHLTRVPPGE
ncbi:MAG: hypothetical protein AAGN82_08085 [Myxococcota bacterium]